MSRTNRDVSIKVGSKLEPLSSVGGIVLAFVVKVPDDKDNWYHLKEKLYCSTWQTTPNYTKNSIKAKYNILPSSISCCCPENLCKVAVDSNILVDAICKDCNEPCHVLCTTDGVLTCGQHLKWSRMSALLILKLPKLMATSIFEQTKSHLLL